MNASYSFVSNSKVLLILSALAIVFAMVQCVLFFIPTYKRALEVGFTKKDVIKIVKSSAIFSVVPSLPIILSYMILLPALGRFFPWLRLSVIGSAAYETMVANMAVTSYGYESLASANFTPDIYAAIMWVCTLGIMLSGMTVFILKSYDKKMTRIMSEDGGFGKMIGPIMFLGMMATFSAPYLIDIKNVQTIAALLGSAVSFLLLDKASKKYSSLKEFVFALSMIFGMISASVVANLLGGM
ncbi:MAG: DUF5058 family protein [Tissierellia bacterium]|nr:DUF5058 family protein [Tissierellia bacterium]